MVKYPGAGKSLRIESDFHFPKVGNTAGSGEKSLGSTAQHSRRSSESVTDSLDSGAISPPPSDIHVAEGREHNIEPKDPLGLLFGSSKLATGGTNVSSSSNEEASPGGLSFAKVCLKSNQNALNIKCNTSASRSFVLLKGGIILKISELMMLVSFSACV